MTRARAAPTDIEKDWPERLRRLVSSLGIEDPRLTVAFLTIPRHRFVDPPWDAEAYLDTPLPVGPEATISAPHMVALQAEWAKIEPGLKVLELGSGSGYLLAILAMLVGPTGHVTGLEIEPALVRRSRTVLAELGLSATTTVLQGEAGHPDAPGGPFDRVLVSFAVPAPVPRSWAHELRPGGFVVAPVTEEGETRLERLRPTATGWEVEPGPPCVFVGQKGRSPSPL